MFWKPCIPRIDEAQEQILASNPQEAAKSADGELMNGIQIERVLSLIDCSIDANMLSLHGEILNYLREHGDELAREISERGYGEIQTRNGPVRISKEDMEPAAA